MKHFYLKISLDNAAFDPEPRREVRRILQGIAEKVMLFDQGVVLDVNGNAVGSFAIKES